MMYLNVKDAAVLFGAKIGSPATSRFIDVQIEMNWKPFRGKNHWPICQPDLRLAGPVRPALHVGKPLTFELWADIFFRFGATGLVVYGPTEVRMENWQSPGLVELVMAPGDIVQEMILWPHDWGEHP
jgi:hypothetical protein